MTGITFVGISFLCVFLFRDAQLLSTSQSSALRLRLGIYFLVLACCVVAASRLQAATPAEIVTALKSTRVWGISVGLHLVGPALCIWLRRLRLLKWAWLVALFPSPMLTLVLLGISTLVSPSPSARTATAVLASAAWTLIVGAISELTRHIGGTESEFAVDFAAASNATVLALFPLAPFF